MSFLENTAGGYATIVPHDTVKQPKLIYAIRVGGAGNVIVKDFAGVSVPFMNCQAGETLAIKTDMVLALASGTTATHLVAYTDVDYQTLP